MGIPLTEENSSPPSPAYMSSNYENGSDGNNNTNRVSYLFVYGNSRPDVPPGSTQNQLSLQNKRAWLLGSRLYSFNDTGGNRRAAVKLDESGNAVLGYAIATDNSTGIARLLDEYERREYSPDLYERDIVEIVTERGERLQSYIYHREEVNPSNLIATGDWLKQ